MSKGLPLYCGTCSAKFGVGEVKCKKCGRDRRTGNSRPRGRDGKGKA